MPEGYNTGNFKPYKSMYVDQKRPEIAQIKRERYDAGKAEYDALNRAVGSVQTLTGDDYTVNNLKNRIEDRMGGVIASGAFENSNYAVGDSVTDFASDTKVAQAAESMENYKKGEALKAEMVAKGAQIYDFDKMVVGTNPDGTPIWGSAADSHVTETGGVYQEKLDTSARVKMLMDGIAEDGGQLRHVAAVAGLTEEEAFMFLKHGTGISEDKVRKIAEALTPLYADSQEGKQKFRALTQLDLATDQAAMDVLQEDLFAYGKKQVGWKNKFIENPYAALLAAQEEGGDPAGIPTTLPSFETSPETLASFRWENQMGMFRGGALDTSISWDEEVVTDKLGSMSTDTVTHTMNSTEALKRYENDLRKHNGDMSKVPMVGSAPLGRLMHIGKKYKRLKLTGESEEEFLHRMSKGLASSAAQVGQVHAYSPDGRRGMADLMLGAGSLLEIVDMTDGADRTPKKLNAWSSAKTTTDDDKWLWTGDAYYQQELMKALQLERSGKTAGDGESSVEIHGVDVSGPNPGATQIVLKTERGTKNIQVSYSSQTKNFFTGVANMAKLIRNPDENRTEEIRLPNMPLGVDYLEMKGSYENQLDGTVQFAPMVKRHFTNGKTDSTFKALPAGSIDGMVQSSMQQFEGNFPTFESDLFKRHKEIRTSVN